MVIDVWTLLDVVVICFKRELSMPTCPFAKLGHSQAKIADIQDKTLYSSIHVFFIFGIH